MKYFVSFTFIAKGGSRSYSNRIIELERTPSLIEDIRQLETKLESMVDSRTLRLTILSINKL